MFRERKVMNKNNTPYRIYSITLLYALHNYHIITFNLHRGLAGQRKPKQETEVLPSRGNRYQHLGSWGDWDLGGRVLERRTLEKRSFRNTQRLSGLCLNTALLTRAGWLRKAWQRRVPQGLRAEQWLSRAHSAWTCGLSALLRDVMSWKPREFSWDIKRPCFWNKDQILEWGKP